MKYRDFHGPRTCHGCGQPLVIYTDPEKAKRAKISKGFCAECWPRYVAYLNNSNATPPLCIAGVGEVSPDDAPETEDTKRFRVFSTEQEASEELSEPL